MCKILSFDFLILKFRLISIYFFSFFLNQSKYIAIRKFVPVMLACSLHVVLEGVHVVGSYINLEMV